MPDVSMIMKNATIEVASVDALEREQLLETLRQYTFAIVRGLVEPDAVKRSVALMRERFDPSRDHATTGEPAAAVRSNFQKMSIGAAKHGGVDRPRFKRVFYNSFFADDIYELHQSFRPVAHLRNLLAELPRDFAIDEVEDGMWTASRIHHFPTGGGFMVGHRDTILPGLYKQQGLDSYYQPLMLMTRKGEDFERGGGFVELDGEIVCYEDFTEVGDIVIYDSATVHGVDDIDTHKPYRQNSLDGRMAALVTLYRDLGS